jgi:NAD(P)H-hydrate epimerase
MAAAAMMQRAATLALSRAQVRDFDRRAIEDFGMPGIVLMENAGRGAAELLTSLGVSGRVVICCGKGNNGGDGFVIARHLDLQKVDVQVLLFCRPEQLRGDAKINCDILTNASFPMTIHADPDVSDAAIAQELRGAEWIVDALFGTGLQGPVRPPFDRVIAAVNESGSKIFAVDIPSGLDCDTGEPQGITVRGQHTATFVATKKGFLQPASVYWTGDVHVIDIGAPRRLLEEAVHAPPGNAPSPP